MHADKNNKKFRGNELGLQTHDCQTFPGTIYQSGEHYTKMTTKLPSANKIYPTVVKLVFQMTRTYYNIFSHSKVLQNIPKLGFLVRNETIVWQPGLQSKRKRPRRQWHITSLSSSGYTNFMIFSHFPRFFGWNKQKHLGTYQCIDLCICTDNRRKLWSPYMYIYISKQFAAVNKINLPIQTMLCSWNATENVSIAPGHGDRMILRKKSPKNVAQSVFCQN
jgi:hypothetical protein